MKVLVSLYLVLFLSRAIAADQSLPAKKASAGQVPTPDFRSKNAAELHARARQLAVENKAAEAVQTYRTLLATAPDLNDARRDLGKLLLKTGDIPAAQKELEECVRRDASEADAHFHLGIAQYRLGQTSQGIASMVEALRLKPDFDEGRKTLGAIFLTENRLMEASALYGETVRRHPEDADAHNDYGVVLTRLGDIDAARERFIDAIKRNPKHVDAHNNLGYARLQEWKLADAVASFRSALEINPRYFDAMMGLGRALSRLGQHEEAKQEFEKALELSPTVGEVHYALAMELLATGQQKQALSRLGEAVRHNPRHADAHRQLGLAMLASGKPAVALPQFRAVLKERPDDAQGHFELGRCLAATGRNEEAIASYREALRLRGDWPEAANQLAWLLATCPDDALRNGGEAARIAKGALKIAELRQPMLIDTLAAAHAADGDFDSALATQQRAVELARSFGDTKLLAEFAKHAAAYQDRKPFREKQLSDGDGGTEAVTK